jgi:hypothetical protein
VASCISRGLQMMEPSSSPARTLSSQRISASVTACRYSVYEAYATRRNARRNARLGAQWPGHPRCGSPRRGWPQEDRSSDGDGRFGTPAPDRNSLSGRAHRPGETQGPADGCLRRPNCQKAVTTSAAASSRLASSNAHMVVRASISVMARALPAPTRRCLNLSIGVAG